MDRATELAPDDIGPEFAPRPREGLSSVEVDGDVVIYDEHNERTHLLNPTAALVWGLLDGSSPITEIAADLAEAFVAPPEAVLRDVLVLIGELGHEGLLEGVAGARTTQ